MTDTPARIIPCPTCPQAVKWTAKNPYRPFCSDRCKLIDLGEWADEQKRIPGDPGQNDVNSGDLESDSF